MNYICEICKTWARQGHVFLMGTHKVTVTSILQNFVKSGTKRTRRYNAWNSSHSTLLAVF